MQTVLILLQLLIEDSCNFLSTNVSYKRDLITIRSRLQHEGLSFVTITLSNFLTDFMSSIEQGSIAPNAFSGWKKHRCLPAFLQGFTKLVFDTDTGRLKIDADIQAIKAIRQICSFFKKVQIECSKARVQQAYDKYIHTDADLDGSICNLNREVIAAYSSVCQLVIGALFNDFRPEELVCHHGPGSTADKRSGNRKFIAKSLDYFEGLCSYFPPGEGILYANPEAEFRSHGEWSQSIIQHRVTSVKCPVQVTHVPKTLKTPRIIAMEPTTMLLIQQGIKDYMVRKIEEHPFTKGHVNFTDQSVNQRLALLSSVTRDLATLDLSEASDRVHNELVKLMFDSSPLLSECLQICRSEQAKVGDSIVNLNKFASMGSALCFPIESLFFYIVILTSRYLAFFPSSERPPLTPKLLKQLKEDVFVYGDDLIVPTSEVDNIVAILRLFGNIVGLNKSFSKSNFRESCGVDAYSGIDITPVYLRHLPPHDRRRPHALVSNVATSNYLYDKGYWLAAGYLKSITEAVVGKLPTFTTLEHEGLGWSFGTEPLKRKFYRFNPELQRTEVRTLVPRPIYKHDWLDGEDALLKCLRSMILRDGCKPSDGRYDPIESIDPGHLERTARRYTLSLKYSWVPFT